MEDNKTKESRDIHSVVKNVHWSETIFKGGKWEKDKKPKEQLSINNKEKH